MIKKIFLLILTIVVGISNSFSQQTGIDKSFHESGKINVVIAVLIVIFIGLIFYLIKLDRKISKIEKENEN